VCKCREVASAGLVYQAWYCSIDRCELQCLANRDHIKVVSLFNNELLGDDSTVGTLAAMINGYQRHDTALVTAAEEGFHTNRVDVSGNNDPLNVGTYFAHAHTVSDPLSTITGSLPSAVATAASLAGAAVADVPPSVAGGMEKAVAHAAPFGTDDLCVHHQQFEHMWG
jgi:hypothetical protein